MYLETPSTSRVHESLNLIYDRLKYLNSKLVGLSDEKDLRTLTIKDDWYDGFFRLLVSIEDVKEVLWYVWWQSKEKSYIDTFLSFLFGWIPTVTNARKYTWLSYFMILSLGNEYQSNNINAMKVSMRSEVESFLEWKIEQKELFGLLVEHCAWKINETHSNWLWIWLLHDLQTLQSENPNFSNYDIVKTIDWFIETRLRITQPSAPSSRSRPPHV